MVFDVHRFIQETSFLTHTDRLLLLQEAKQAMVELQSLTLDSIKQVQGKAHQYRSTFELLGLFDLSNSAKELYMACQSMIDIQPHFIQFQKQLVFAIDALSQCLAQQRKIEATTYR